MSYGGQTGSGGGPGAGPGTAWPAPRTVAGGATRSSAREGEAAASAITVNDLLGMVRRHVPMIIVLFTLICSSGVAATLYQYANNPSYEARAAMRVDPGTESQGHNVAPTEALPAGMLGQFISTQISRFLDRDVLQMALSADLKENVMRADLGQRPGNEAELQDRVAYIQAHQSDLLGTGDHSAELSRQLQVGNPYGTILISVRLRGHDRKLITAVVNSVIESYLLSYGKDRQDRERRLLEGLIKNKHEKQLVYDEAERQLTSFKRESGLLAQGEHPDVTSQLRIYEDALAKAYIELVGVSTQNQQMQSPDEATLMPDMELRVEADGTLSGLRAAESQLQRTRDQLLKSFGPQHESIRSVDAELATTRKQIKDRRNDLTVTLVAEQQQAIKGAFQSAQSRYDQLAEKYKKAQQDAMDLQDKLIKYQTLSDNYARAREDMRLLDQDIERTRVTAEISANSVSVAGWATEPQKTEKAGPSLLVYLPGSVFLGLLISIGLALLVELIDNRIRTPQQIVRLLHLPVLGTVPDRKEDQDVRTLQDLPLASARAPQSLIAESFRQLRTALMYSTDTDLKTLLITSPKGGTGKSIVASNLAVTMALGGSRVLLVDTNFRRPMVHRFFDLPNSVGLSSVLARLNSLDEAIQNTTVANLDVLSCGPLPPSPADLLGSEAMQILLVEAGKRYDNIILDGAPVLVVADAHVLCGMADGTVLVIDGLETSRGVAGRARRTLLGFRARLVGAVLNRVRARKGGYFREAYQSYYEYAAEAKAPTK